MDFCRGKFQVGRSCFAWGLGGVLGMVAFQGSQDIMGG